LALVITISTIIATIIATIIVCLSLRKSHANRFGTTIISLTLLKFHFLPFAKAIEFHSYKVAAMEEEVFSLFWLDKPKTTVHEPFDCALSHIDSPFPSPAPLAGLMSYLPFCLSFWCFSIHQIGDA